MEPRLKSSTQWTAFPEELIQQITEVAEDHFSDYEKEDRQFLAEGCIYPSEIVLRLGLSAPKGSLRQDNFEASLQYDPEKEKALDLIHLVVDFLAETWATYFEDSPENEDLPRLWTEQVFEKKPIYLRYSTENSDLEKQANALLQLDDKQLVYGEMSAIEEAAPQEQQQTVDSLSELQ
ncbi:hypothetical protein K2X05_04710 [bacterium]|nr:hypothetical protein [bacterium]